MAFIPAIVKGALALKDVVGPVVVGTAAVAAGKMIYDSYTSEPEGDLLSLKHTARQRSRLEVDPSSSPDRVQKEFLRVSSGNKSSRRSSTKKGNSAGDDDDEERRPNIRKNLDDEHVSVSRHVLYRLLRFIRFAGIIQRASLVTGIARHDVIRSEASQYQDRSSHQRGYHAAHIIRGSRINSQIQNNHPNLYNELRNFAGHTQIVPVYANAWHGLGGDMDRLQSAFFNQLARIDFNTSEPTEEAQNILYQLRAEFINLLDEHIASDRLGPAEISELERAKEEISYMDADDLFKKGRDGYNGRYSSHYQ